VTVGFPEAREVITLSITLASIDWILVLAFCDISRP
jgi:hypothetical protein